jgi:hypothetical protein
MFSRNTQTLTKTLNLSSLMSIFCIGSSNPIPSGNRLWTSNTLFQTVSRACAGRKSFGKKIRRRLRASIVDNKTGTTRGSPFSPAGQGWTDPGVAIEVLRSLGSVEPREQLRRTSTMYDSCGGYSSGFGVGRF